MLHRFHRTKCLLQPCTGTLSVQPNRIDLSARMDGRLDLVLDGGTCIGTGSTTVDITEPVWRVIKEGAITEKEIAERLQADEYLEP